MKCIQEKELPGIGKKFQIEARSGDKMVVVVHDDGRREIYHYYHDDPDESISMVTLDDAEARCVAGILGGMNYQPKALENMELALHDLLFDWYKVEPGSYSIGKSIGELEIRKKTGASIIALIDQDNVKTINPGTEAVFKEGDTVVILGERHEVLDCKNLILNGSI